MRFGPGPAILAVVLSFAAAPGWAEDCPAKSTDMDDIIAAVNDASSCDRAMKVAEACAYVRSTSSTAASSEKTTARAFLSAGVP